MNVKAMAAIVGTLSLGALATGCATAKPAAAASEEKGSESACKGDAAAATPEKGAEQSCKSDKAQTTTEKGSEHSCGASGCGGAAPKKE
jgi:uncharacterized low-complexity protein